MPNKDQTADSAVSDTRSATTLRTRRAWQRPQLQRLEIALDTRGGIGSISDGEGPERDLA